MIGVNYCDTELEFLETCDEWEQNPDFSYVGSYDSIQDIYHELNYQGLSDEEIEKLSVARYGNCLEIVEYGSTYEAYIGAR